MPIENIAFYNAKADVVALEGFDDTVMLRLQVKPSDAGKYVVFARVVICNGDADPQFASARLTTLDGVTELDKATVRIEGNGDAQSISLQATLSLPNAGQANDIVDLRCATYKGYARDAVLTAIRVDGLESGRV